MTAASALAICGCSEKDETEKKIDDLLSRMTLHEKIGQMNQLSGGDWLTEAAEKGEVGSILNCVDPAEINRVQKAAVERSRLGIPILVSRDVIHGFKTIFPIPLGLAATFDPELVESGARVAAVEAASCGVRWTFSPMLDISRDPRWGRIAESSGEDPYLDAVMGTAMVRGYQGNGDSTSIAACLKHFVGYGATEGGRDYNTVELSERTLRNVYFPAFQAGVDAGAMTLMTSFNTIDGVPSTGNKWLLQDILRGEWGFDGMIVTDWNSSGEMIMHGFAKDLKDATDLAVNAGVEMDMMSYGYISFIEELVKEKKISEKQIDDAVRDILRLKFRPYDFIPRVDGKWIRLRTNGIKSTLTIKNLVSSEIDGTQELEIEVDNFERCNLILKELGYEPKGYQENRRRQYLLNGVEIDIDSWPMIPDYLEIEGPSEEAVFNTLEVLGFSKEDSTTRDVEGIFLDYGYKLDEIYNLKLEENRKEGLEE